MRLASSIAIQWKLMNWVRDRRSFRRRARARADWLIGKIVKWGEDFVMLDGLGQPIGTIPSPEKPPRLGRNEETIFLWRRN